MLSTFGSKIYAWCYKSETILWSRLQGIVGVLTGLFFLVWGVVSSADMSAVITNPKYLALWLMFNAFVTELLRRRKTEVIDGSLVKKGLLPTTGPLVNTEPSLDTGPGDVGQSAGPAAAKP